MPFILSSLLEALFMGLRTRIRNGPPNLAGRYTVYLKSGGSVTTNSSSGIRTREECTDTTMPKPYDQDHNLNLLKRLAIPYRVNGTYMYPSGTYSHITYSNYNFAFLSSYANSPSLSPQDMLYWKTKALANLNPYRPVVDLPLTIWELKDLPKSLWRAGNFLAKRGRSGFDPAGDYLAWNFGWAPLISDLQSMIKFTDLMEERKAYLLALESGHEVKRTLSKGLIEDTEGVESSLSMPSTTVKAVRMAVRHRTHRRVWYTSNAKLKDPLPTGVALDALSRDIVFGTHFQPERLWDFFPWTWLIDYFAAVGDTLEAWGTLSRLEVTRMNVMATTRRSTTYVLRESAPGISASQGLMVTVRKQRAFFANPTPSLRFVPTLSGKQISILGALVVARNKRAFSVLGS